MVENNRQIKARSGPYFEHWVRRTIVSFHKKLVAAKPDE